MVHGMGSVVGGCAKVPARRVTVVEVLDHRPDLTTRQAAAFRTVNLDRQYANLGLLDSPLIAWGTAAPAGAIVTVGPPRPCHLPVTAVGDVPREAVEPFARTLGVPLDWRRSAAPAPAQVDDPWDLLAYVDPGRLAVVRPSSGVIRVGESEPWGVSVTVGGVAVTGTAVIVADPDVVQHELAHALGLHHTVEADGTPGAGGGPDSGGCPARCDLDGDGAVTLEECERPSEGCWHRNNVMYWGVASGLSGDRVWGFTQSQVDLMRRHPLLDCP